MGFFVILYERVTFVNDDIRRTHEKNVRNSCFVNFVISNIGILRVDDTLSNFVNDQARDDFSKCSVGWKNT